MSQFSSYLFERDFSIDVRVESTASVDLQRVEAIKLHIDEILNRSPQQEEIERLSVYVNLGKDATDYKANFHLLSGQNVGYNFEARGSDLTLVEKV